MSRAVMLGTLGLAVMAAGTQAWAQPARRVGTVRFETSCAPAARAPFTRGVANLHSFDFADAVRSFTQALVSDSTCVIAHWGLALSAWGNPFAAGMKADAQLERGAGEIQRGRRAGRGTDRERAYLAAVARLYDDHAARDQRTRVLAYRDAMATLAARYPRDDEASIFYAAALAFSADPTDKTYEQQRKAGAILERLSPRLPDHPGIAHYLIHTYDIPSLAAKGRTAANRYAAIAPSSAHALHMPSHTFTRVGAWSESIVTNIKSAKAAVAERSVAEALHANDYMMYAYLQTGQDSAAARVLAALPDLVTRFDPNVVGSGAPPAAGYFAMAAIPARFALERGDWRAAAKLDVRETSFRFTDAITWFARGIGAARMDDTVASAQAADQLARMRDALTERKEAYWSEQVEIQRRSVVAWRALARGDRQTALTEMRAAAEMEAATDKNAMTPGPILPARELLAEMLLTTGDAAGALREFEGTLAVEPGRFRALAGAMQAARAEGDPARVRRYARELARVAARGDTPGRAELAAARRALR